MQWKILCFKAAHIQKHRMRWYMQSYTDMHRSKQLNRFMFPWKHFTPWHKCHTTQWYKIPYADSPSLDFALDSIWSSSNSFAFAIFLTIFSSSVEELLCHFLYFDKEPFMTLTIQLCPLCVSLSKLLQQMLYLPFLLRTLRCTNVTNIHTLQQHLHNH